MTDDSQNLSEIGKMNATKWAIEFFKGAFGKSLVPPEKLAYARITFPSGGKLITEKEMVDQCIANEVEGGANPEDFTVDEVLMTEEEYENLPEYDGS